MERTKVKWRKIGGGNFRLGKKIIKPNEVFSASPDEIPQMFMKFLVQLEQAPDEPIIVRTKKKFDVKPVEVENWDAPVKAFQAEVDEMLERSTPVLPESPMDYQIEAVTPGWFNVVNVTTGKTVNEKKLRKADAEKVMMELNG